MGPLFSPDNYFYLNENQVKMEYILRALCGVLPNREMASIIVAHLTFSDVSDRDSAIYLDEPVSVVRSFESELRKKQTAALRDIIPRHDTNSKFAVWTRRLAVPLPTTESGPTAANVGVPPARAQPLG